MVPHLIKVIQRFLRSLVPTTDALVAPREAVGLGAGGLRFVDTGDLKAAALGEGAQ